MTLKEMKKEHARLGKLIREAEEGRFLKHEFIQADIYPRELSDHFVKRFDELIAKLGGEQ